MKNTNKQFSADEEIAIQDALHDPIEVEDEELDDDHYDDHYDEPDHEGLDNLNDPTV